MVERHSWPAVFAVVVGIGMVGQWTFALLTGSVPEVETRPTALGFHLAAEGLTAALLVVAGVAMLLRRRWGRWVYAVATGMLLYTAIVSPGYFLQEGRPVFVLLFAVILVLATLCLVVVARGDSRW